MGKLMDRMPEVKRNDCTEEAHVSTCPGCGRSVQVESVVCVGWKDKEEVICPGCGVLVETITATFVEVE